MTHVSLTEESLPAIIDAMSVPACVVTAGAAIVRMNAAAKEPRARLAGADAPIGTLADLFSSGCESALTEAIAAAAAGAHSVVVRAPEPDSETTYLVHPLARPDGSVDRLAVVAMPTNGVRLPERELRETEERYRKLVELLPDAIMVHSEGRVEYLNAAGARLWGGESPRALVGMLYMDLVHPDDRTFVQDRVHRIEQGVESPLREYRIVRLDGRVVPVEAAGTLISFRGRPSNLVMFRDITARKEAEVALRETMTRYRSLFENSPISLWEEDWSRLKRHLDMLRASGVTDLSDYLNERPENLSYCFSLLRLKNANRACVRFYGAQDRAELMANMEKLFPEESDIIRESLVAVSQGHRYIVTEGLTHTLAGEERHVIYHFLVLPGCEDTLDTVMASVVDLTAQKRVELRLTELNARLKNEEAQRRLLSQRLMDMIENDRRGVAMELHDHFGQMMTTLKLDLEVLAAGLEGADPRLRSRVEDAAARATRTIGDLKTMASGLMPSMIENLGLTPALQALVDDVRSRAKMEIHFFSSGVSERFDHNMELALYRIAQESINNVVKHAGASRVDVNLVEKDAVVSLSVEDNGIGFACDQDRQLWRGGPLGLHIMRERAAQFGGELTIETRPGEGAHVLVEIPL